MRTVDADRDAATRWRDALAAWAIPAEILSQAKEDPWALPPALFEHDQPQRTISHERALEYLTAGSDILDVGAGRCAMSLPLRPPAGRIVAVDSQPSMLADSPADRTVLGRWPEVAAEAGQGDVVVCGHVFYNVADLAPFVTALTAAARRGVVVEMTRTHPRDRAMERALWRHFWGLERPTGPSWEDARAVLRDQGIEPRVDEWTAEARGSFEHLEHLVEFMRRTICLDPSRDPEVRAVVLDYAAERDGRWRLSVEPRRLVTLSWPGGGATLETRGHR